MSAMRAPALPETHADRIAPAIWTVPAQIARPEPEPAQPASAGAASDQMVHGRLESSAPVRMRTASSGAGRAEAARNRTRRDLAARGATAGGIVARSALTLGTPALGTPTRGPAVWAQAGHGQAAAAPLRLTKRGSIVVAAAAAMLVSMLSLLATGAAQATSHSAPQRVADRNLAQVIVQSGQSLWSVAQSADPSADPRQVMQQIIELNGLTSDMIFTGERLWVPRG